MLLWLCWCWSDYTWEDQEVVWGVYENCLLIIYCLQGRSCFGLIMPLPPHLRLFSSSKNWYLPILLGCIWNIDSSGLAPEKSDLRGLGWGRKRIIWQEPVIRQSGKHYTRRRGNPALTYESREVFSKSTSNKGQRVSKKLTKCGFGLAAQSLYKL